MVLLCMPNALGTRQHSSQKQALQEPRALANCQLQMLCRLSSLRPTLLRPVSTITAQLCGGCSSAAALQYCTRRDNRPLRRRRGNQVRHCACFAVHVPPGR
jgi:hypothetical protein